MASDFHEEWNLPNVIGAVDGKHINIQCPRYGGPDYFNYKGFHSTNLMAVCDAKYRLLFIDIGSYGRDNDAAVFGQTKLFQLMDSSQANLTEPSNVEGYSFSYVLVGDESFPLQTWLMKPFSGANLNLRQLTCNYRLSRSRRTIENGFGILSSCWRIFARPINANLDLIDLIVQACSCLHDYFLLTDNARYVPAGFVDLYDSTGTLVEGGWRSDRRSKSKNSTGMSGL